MSRRNQEQTDQPAVRFARRGEVGTVTLQGRISVADAEEVLAVSRQALNDVKARRVHLLCDAVEHTDLSSLQILLSLSQALKASDRGVEVTPPAHHGAKEAFRLVGLGA